MTDPSNWNWRERAQVFDRASRDYADARPGYPPALFQLLRGRCSLGHGTRVLEIGAGAGQATLPLLRNGAKVTAIEPGPDLAAQLRARTGGLDLEIVVSRFEDASLPENAFDLVACATAFHWLDADVALARCASALRDHGWLALWWNVFGDEARPDPFHHALQPVLGAKAPQLIAEGNSLMPYALDTKTRRAEIRRARLFGPIQYEVFRWEGRHDPVALRRMFGTFSNFIALPDALRLEILDDIERIAREDFGGLVVRPYQTVLYLAQRTARSES